MSSSVAPDEELDDLEMSHAWRLSIPPRTEFSVVWLARPRKANTVYAAPWWCVGLLESAFSYPFYTRPTNFWCFFISFIKFVVLHVLIANRVDLGICFLCTLPSFTLSPRLKTPSGEQFRGTLSCTGAVESVAVQVKAAAVVSEGAELSVTSLPPSNTTAPPQAPLPVMATSLLTSDILPALPPAATLQRYNVDIGLVKAGSEVLIPRGSVQLASLASLPSLWTCVIRAIAYPIASGAMVEIETKETRFNWGGNWANQVQYDDDENSPTWPGGFEVCGVLFCFGLFFVFL